MMYYTPRVVQDVRDRVADADTRLAKSIPVYVGTNALVRTCTAYALTALAKHVCTAGMPSTTGKRCAPAPGRRGKRAPVL